MKRIELALAVASTAINFDVEDPANRATATIVRHRIILCHTTYN